VLIHRNGTPRNRQYAHGYYEDGLHLSSRQFKSAKTTTALLSLSQHALRDHLSAQKGKSSCIARRCPSAAEWNSASIRSKMPLNAGPRDAAQSSIFGCAENGNDSAALTQQREASKLPMQYASRTAT
jgi:hypothetical protein